MTQQHVLQACQDLLQGNANYNGGHNVYCALIDDVWYPLHALINRASILAGENPNYTTSKACKSLVCLFPFVNIKRLDIQDAVLPTLTRSERLDWIKSLSDLIRVLADENS